MSWFGTRGHGSIVSPRIAEKFVQSVKLVLSEVEGSVAKMLSPGLLKLLLWGAPPQVTRHSTHAAVQSAVHGLSSIVYRPPSIVYCPK